MNLVDEPWIPVIFQNRESKKVSLMDVFKQGEAIRDLSVNPVQRISLMRLLICITQAALDGPEDEKDWMACKSKIAPEAMRYLEKWKDRFELYGKRPFLQIFSLKAVKEKDRWSTPIDKLDIILACGNAHTLFDRKAGDAYKRAHVDTIPLMLLVCQCFSLGGGQSKKANWGNEEVDGLVNNGAKNNNFTAAPCTSSKLFTLIRTGNLCDSIHMNLITKEMVTEGMPNSLFGTPLWEEFPNTYKGSASDIKKDYLPRLVPLARFLRLDDDNPTWVNIFTNGYSYKDDPLLFRESMCTVMQTDDGANEYYKITAGKHPWRDLNSLISLRMRHTGALSLAHLENAGDRVLDIWVGGLLSNQGKPVEGTEWSFAFSPEMLYETFYLRYDEGVRLASQGDSIIRKAISEYYYSNSVGEFDKEENGDFSRNDKRSKKHREKIFEKASLYYWSILDQKYKVLLKSAEDQSVDPNDTWYPIVRQAMKDAYAFACPHETVRQIQAFSKGKQKLRLKKLGEQ